MNLKNVLAAVFVLSAVSQFCMAQPFGLTPLGQKYRWFKSGVGDKLSGVKDSLKGAGNFVKCNSFGLPSKNPVKINNLFKSTKTKDRNSAIEFHAKVEACLYSDHLQPNFVDAMATEFCQNLENKVPSREDIATPLKNLCRRLDEKRQKLVDSGDIYDEEKARKDAENIRKGLNIVLGR